jgi:hypothetical protein
MGQYFSHNVFSFKPILTLANIRFKVKCYNNNVYLINILMKFGYMYEPYGTNWNM